MLQGIKRLTALGVVALLLALPGQAIAQSASNATNEAYEDASVAVVGDPADPASPGRAETSSAGSLPFSGLDVALLAAGGATLVLIGVGMRRLTRRPDLA